MSQLVSVENKLNSPSALLATILQQTMVLAGVIFARKSPQRLRYSKSRLNFAIGCACLLGYLAHTLFLGLDPPQALVKLVFEIAVLIIGLRYLSKTSLSRQKLMKMTLSLFLISIYGDGSLLLLSLIGTNSSSESALAWAAFGVMLSELYGASNVVQHTLEVSWRIGAAYVLGYIALVITFYELAILAL